MITMLKAYTKNAKTTKNKSVFFMVRAILPNLSLMSQNNNPVREKLMSILISRNMLFFFMNIFPLEGTMAFHGRNRAFYGADHLFIFL